MFAQLGNIQFNLITYFEGIDESQKFNYAEHQTIESKPKLQFIGEELDELDIKLNFHSSYCIPEDELKKLKDTAKKHQELPFILGNGKYMGKYVVQEITSTTQQSDRSGNLIAIEAEIKLKEWSDDNVKAKKKAKKQTTKKKQKTNTTKKKAKSLKQIVRQQ